MPTKYRIKHTPEIGEGKKGDIVYECIIDNRGMAPFISRETGQLYLTVTPNPTGTQDHFPILAHYLEEVHD